jgi:hypothetical protein
MPSDHSGDLNIFSNRLIHSVALFRIPLVFLSCARTDFLHDTDIRMPFYRLTKKWPLPAKTNGVAPASPFSLADRISRSRRQSSNRDNYVRPIVRETKSKIAAKVKANLHGKFSTISHRNDSNSESQS